VFHEAFAPSAADAGLTRRGRKGAKWTNRELEFNFRVNPKAAGIADCPGEFWPVISWNGPRYGPRDDGTVSYYQYVTQSDLGAIQAMRSTVLEKQAVRGCPYLQTLREGLEPPFYPQQPHSGLFYVDEEDARAWGGWFGGNIAGWLKKFTASPETLEAWVWRVVWDEKTRGVSQPKMLHLAVKHGDLATLKRMLQEDQALANARSLTDKRGTTPLHVAAEFDRAEAARVLLEHGADPALLDVESEATALCWAAFHGRARVAEVLAAAGVGLSERNKHGLTPLGCALGGVRGEWRRFSDATIDDWRRIADLLRGRGALE
jgi:hypothetical protein